MGKPFSRAEADRTFDRAKEDFRELLVHQVIHIRLHGSPPPSPPDGRDK